MNMSSSSKPRARAVCVFAVSLLTASSSWADATIRGNAAMGLGIQIAANAAVFTSRAAARNFIAATLPRVTAANPAYVTKSDGATTRWLTKSVRFEDTLSELRVSMKEEFTQRKARASTVGTHEAAFLLADVEISATISGSDVTPKGEPAMLILFKCTASKCIDATWDGQAVPRTGPISPSRTRRCARGC